MSDMSRVVDINPGLANIRERLEAVLWRLFPDTTPQHIQVALAAADSYAMALADDQTVRKSLPAMRLAEATAEYYGQQAWRGRS